MTEIALLTRKKC